jgi:hypothetical protein
LCFVTYRTALLSTLLSDSLYMNELSLSYVNFLMFVGAVEDQKSKIYVRVFVVLLRVYSQWSVGVGKNKTNPSRKENGPNGQ